MRSDDRPIRRRRDRRLRSRCQLRKRLAIDEVQHFGAVQHLALEQRLGNPHQRFRARLDDLFRLVVAVLDELSHLLVDLDRGLFAVIAMLCDLEGTKVLDRTTPS